MRADERQPDGAGVHAECGASRVGEARDEHHSFLLVPPEPAARERASRRHFLRVQQRCGRGEDAGGGGRGLRDAGGHGESEQREQAGRRSVQQPHAGGGAGRIEPDLRLPEAQGGPFAQDRGADAAPEGPAARGAGEEAAGGVLPGTGHPRDGGRVRDADPAGRGGLGGGGHAQPRDAEELRRHHRGLRGGFRQDHDALGQLREEQGRQPRHRPRVARWVRGEGVR